MKTKTKLFLSVLLTLFFVGGAYSQSAVNVGTQVTSESSIESGKSYVLQSQASGTPYIADAGSYYSIPASGGSATEACVYQFVSNGDGTWKIKSSYTGKYWGIPVSGEDLKPSNEVAAGEWKLNFSSGTAYPTAPDADGVTRGLDRYDGHLWGYTTGTGGTKAVKIYELNGVPLSSLALEELQGKIVTVGETPANDLATGQWYVMYDRGVTGTYRHGYLYEDANSHTLYNTETVPGGAAVTAACFLVRLSDAGDGKYYVQTGFGNYFGVISQSAAVPVTATKEEALTISKIAGTDGHFYIQSTTSNIVLDANDLRSGDATVVGWGTTAPTTVGGNNDWAFYPVILEDISDAVAIFEDNVEVRRGYQTCGRGNTNSLMLRIDVTPFQAMSQTTLKVSLNEAAQANISSLYVYETTATEFLANIPASPVGTTNEIGSTTSITIGNVSAGAHRYWLCATVKADAELETILEAALTGIDYSRNGSDETLSITSGNPGRQGMKVFDKQTFVFKPTTDNCRFYRIPAMILDRNGDIVVAADKRYNSNSDLGNHKIDVVSMRSEDGGRTWGSKANVAIGSGSSADNFGYGDAALARAVNNDLVCIMAAGNKMWGQYPTDGMKYAGFAKSTDDGRTWSLTRNLFTSSKFYDEGRSNGALSVDNIFTSSGKGLTTNDGIIMFTTNCRAPGTSSPNLIYVLYSTDNGDTWRHSNALAYTAGDESKLEQLSDGSLLLSVRQSGNRGWNTATYTKNADGSVTFNWGQQYRTSDIWGNACNADIICYSRKADSGRNIMLHCNVNSSGRESLQLSMSLDEGKTWHGVYNIQPNGSCYSTTIVLPDGSLAILYEDESYSAGNGYAINFVTITKEQILAWYENLDDQLYNPVVKIVEHGNSDVNAPWGTWQNTTTSNWAKQFTTHSGSGQSGVVVSAETYAFNRQTSYDQRVFCIRPSAAGATDVITIAAPTGYLIDSYSIGGYFGTSSETYTLTAENGSSVDVNKNKSQQNPPDFLTVSGINAPTTTFSFSNSNSTNNNYALITNFVLKLRADDGEGPTGIASRWSSPENADGKIYTIQGIPLAKEPSQKGIYLQNGRKFVVR